MRRFSLIFGMLLTFTAVAWGSAQAAEWCAHEAGAPSASDEHDCCRAKIGGSDAGHSPSQETSHDASHENLTTRNQAEASHAGMNCGRADAASTTETGNSAFAGLSCAECCAGGSGQTPATAAVVAPEQNKVKRDAGRACARSRDLFAPAALDVSRLAPSQHAPPAPPSHRHILLGVFLI
ncbi:MAG TPA: hypothetical protein VK388_14630 [Pyrinomonadaceae bacterium]|nr:hypothetical protein [Pyrinomonadaceae bacterium]